MNELLSCTPNAPGTSTGVSRVIAGEYKVVASKLYVRSTPSRRLKSVACYVRGEHIFDVAADTIKAEGYIWAHYVGASGMTRYVAMGTASGGERYLVKV